MTDAAFIIGVRSVVTAMRAGQQHDNVSILVTRQTTWDEYAAYCRTNGLYFLPHVSGMLYYAFLID